MNPWQVAQQIQYKLELATWPDGNTELVFGTNGVYVTASLGEDAVDRIRLPSVFIVPSTATPDDDAPELLTQEFEVTLVAHSNSDAVGEHVLIGGPRSGGAGSSKGRGLLELEEELLKAIGQLNDTGGVSIKLTHASSVEVENVDGMGFIGVKVYSFDARCQRERYYHPALRLTGTGVTGGDASLTWALPPARWDFNQLTLRRASGSTAPASATAGTAVSLSAPTTDTSHTDSPGSGTFSYSLFAGYDEDGDGTDDRYSAAASVTVVVP